jgi:small subunit ribosomal protein S10
MKIQLHLKSYHAYYLNNLVFHIQTLCTQTLYSSKTQLFLPLKIEKYTLLRSPHVDKKSREQFERITHKRVLTIQCNCSLQENKIFIERLLYLVQTTAVGVELNLGYTHKC